MEKEQEWVYAGNEKMSDFSDSADILLLKPSYSEKEVEQYPTLKGVMDYISIQQTGSIEDTEKPYHMQCGTLDIGDYEAHFDTQNKSTEEIIQKAAELAYTKGLPDYSDHYDFNKDEALMVLDARGADPREAVENGESLGDYYNSSVISHNQSMDEKKMVLSSIRNMMPGDELTFTITDPRVYEFASPEKHHMACVEKDKLLDFTIAPNNITRPLRNVSRHEHTTWEISQKDRLRLNLFDSATLDVHFIPLEKLEDLKINKNHFTKEECEALRQGDPIDYNKTMDRNKIYQPEDYMEYVLRSQNKKELSAQSNELTKETQKAQTNFEYGKVYGEVMEATTLVRTEKNKDLLPAIKTLRDASLHVTHDGLEGQNMAMALDAVADGLARGRGLDLSCTMAEKDHPYQSNYVDIIKEQMGSRYPELDKGLEKLIEKREEKFYLKENHKATPKVKAKGIHRKPQGNEIQR